MDNELIERLAKESGLVTKFQLCEGNKHWPSDIAVLAKFASLVAEECAKTAEGAYRHGNEIHGTRLYFDRCAAAIRAKFA